jgi:N-hydroxyarylamine O-acetyltransferase
MDVQACLNRIGYQGSREPSYETLCNLQRAFLLSVPFENFDIHLGRYIEIDPERVFHKVVEQRRGGFCYELNSLFHALLSELGFDVEFHAARMLRDGKPGREAGHMILIVNLGERYIVDVGNGKSCREPLPLARSKESAAEDFLYRTADTDLGPAVLEKPKDGDWRTRFIFGMTALERQDFLEPCRWTQTSPDSIFTRNRICTLARHNGRITLLNSTLTVSDENGSRDTDVPAGSYADCLNEYFGIKVQQNSWVMST